MVIILNNGLTHHEIFKLPSMDDEEVEELLSSQRICRMALNDVPQPYIIALDYLYLDGELYFHFADYGRKMDLIKKDPHVSIEIDDFCVGATTFSTITLMGQLEKEANSEQKKRAARALVDSVKARGGKKNVAARHGLKLLSIDTLSSPPSALYRLTVSDYVALKSPS
jgi:nitroimidazol reductase NimA-like FMN-containing flavoprotein (pyridoxamine 5'-phosphate oxidase superfamily)